MSLAAATRYPRLALAPCPAQAELMRRVLPHAVYRTWLHRFLPPSALPPLLAAVPEAAAGNPQAAHLLELVFHHAWCLYAIACNAGAGSQPWRSAAQTARRSAAAAVAAPFTGGYAVNHTFILYFHRATSA